MNTKSEIDDEEETQSVSSDKKRLKSDQMTTSLAETANVKCQIDEKVNTFLEWCNSVGIIIDQSKVKITRNSTSHNYGMIAIEDIQTDEILAHIPKTALLEPKTTQIKELISLNPSKLKSKSNWAKLVITLMYELNNPNSKWSIYLKMFPNYDYFDLPMFWNKSSMTTLLSNTCVPSNVEVDLKNMKDEFEQIILPFLNEHKDQFSENCFDFNFYKKIIGFIMAYSFRDPNEDQDNSESVGPMMVPVGDILNHIALNNAQLRFDTNELVICATKPIKKNDEVFNTYGEHSNTDLLHMYGFVETYPQNIFDSVEIPTKYLIQAILHQKNDKDEILNKKLQIIKEIELIEDDCCFIVGHDGILNEEECLNMLQIYSMTNDELNEFIENDYELLEDEQWDNFSLMNDMIHKLPIDWKILLQECCEMHLSQLKASMNELNPQTEKEFLALENENNKIDSAIINQRVRYVTTLKSGHIELVKKFINALRM